MKKFAFYSDQGKYSLNISEAVEMIYRAAELCFSNKFIEAKDQLEPWWEAVIKVVQLNLFATATLGIMGKSGHCIQVAAVCTQCMDCPPKHKPL